MPEIDFWYSIGSTYSYLTVKRLEEDLGVKLLDRLPRGVSPTLFGEALAAHANLIGGELTRAREAITALRSGQSGRVVVVRYCNSPA